VVVAVKWSLPKKKRATWHDRKCHHGNEPVIRITYDFIHCERPECWEEVLAHVGFLQKTPLRDAAPELLRACKLVADIAVCWEAVTPGDIAEVRAAIAKAEGR
jgi:hypothetical protein